MKKHIYNAIAHSGIWFLHTFFPEYFANEPLNPTDRYIEYPFVIGNLPSPPATVLDVGCSGSMFPLLLKALKYDVHGIDIREYYPQYKIMFTKGNIGAVTVFKDNYFDIVTAISSIEHIGLKGTYGQKQDMAGDIKAMKEIHRILKPKGTLLLTVPYGDKYVITRNHKIYNYVMIHQLLLDFVIQDINFVQSPEANYQLALVKAIKQ